jgi:gas vesicle protein
MLGAGLALLFAPKPGDETRREVAERAQRVGDKARAGIGTASDRVAQFAERGKAMYETAAEKAREAAKAVREGRDPGAAIADAADETFS